MNEIIVENTNKWEGKRRSIWGNRHSIVMYSLWYKHFNSFYLDIFIWFNQTLSISSLLYDWVTNRAIYLKFYLSLYTTHPALKAHKRFSNEEKAQCKLSFIWMYSVEPLRVQNDWIHKDTVFLSIWAVQNLPFSFVSCLFGNFLSLFYFYGYL